MKARLLLAFVTIIPNVVRADEAGQGYGVGMHSCAEFAKSYMANPTAAEDIYFTWAQGFMSGLNLSDAASGRAYKAINGGDMATQKAYIRSYCDVHPLAQYVGAIVQLYTTLPNAKP